MKNTKVTLVPLASDDREQFILDNQWAFKYGALQEFGKRDDHINFEGEIISRKTIERCIDAPDRETYRIVVDGKKVGGVILRIDKETHHNELEILFTLPDEHSKGIGYGAWQAVEALHRGIRNCLTQGDAADILRQVEHLNEADQPFIMLPMLTGMRRGECLGLMWSDIDFSKRIITVSRAITFAGNQPVVDTPKSAAGYRQIPLLPELQAFLLSLPRQGEFVIGGQRPITEQVYQRTWERINRTIDLHGATAHVFRHTFATLAAVHTDVKNLQAIMGHSDIQTTMNRYTHPQEIRVMAAVEDLAGMFDNKN